MKPIDVATTRTEVMNAERFAFIRYMFLSTRLSMILAAFMFWADAVHAESPIDREGLAFFEASIRPILVERCYQCHSESSDELKGGLRLDTRSGTRAGGDSGPTVVPGDPTKSLLMAAIRHDGLEMPPDARLAEQDIAHFERWIQMGAPDPRDGPDVVDRPKFDLEKARDFWSFQSIVDPELPKVSDGAWPENAIDYFVLSKLEQAGLRPTHEAERLDLLRRVTYDLLGLPPTLEQIDEFLADRQSDAYERLVDRLLASPQYGERWGQHWLDVVRYAETEGFEYDRTIPGVWRYRDYVIQALNEGLAYDDFLREQIAGDEIDANDPKLMAAASFHRLGTVRRNAGNQEVAGSRNEVLTERTDIIGSAVLGMTIGCARCHDHKFDPLSQRDYYSLQAYFAATHEHELALVDKVVYEDWKQNTLKIQKQIDQLSKRLSAQSGEEEKATIAKIRGLESELPAPIPLISSIRNDFENLTPIHVLKRGDFSLPGDRVRPNPPTLLQASLSNHSSADDYNPRTALADWLVDNRNPLTPRVIVNRIWHYHFGQGIVKSPNDFGKNGQTPSHPELLDYLAMRLIESRWELKPLHRLILLSGTYRQASDSADERVAKELDPENQLLWRFNKRRLSAEEIRDSMLAVSGELNFAKGGPSILLPVDEQLKKQLYNPSQWKETVERSEQVRRSIYLIAKRNLRLPFMEVFDQPTLQVSCANREESTHAPQALELLNGSISNELAEKFAARLKREVSGDLDRYIEVAYRLSTGRPPNRDERRLATMFLNQGDEREFALAMFNLNAFLYLR